MRRILAIGDVHGCSVALQGLVMSVPIRDDDLVITLGDYVDRGPDSRTVLDWLIAREATGNLIPLRGNHEVMMLEARGGEDLQQGWLGVGGRATLASYPNGTDEQFAAIPASHWQFLEQTRRYYETQTHFFVHANALPDWPLEEQPDDVIFWEKFHDTPPHQSGKIMVCGHTPQASFRPRNIGHAVCIDTWAYHNGWLTCLNPETGEYWQANQLGQVRINSLS